MAQSSSDADNQNQQASLRFSTHSKASEAPTYKTDASDAPSYSSESQDAEIRAYERSAGRMEDQRFDDQRYVRSQERIDEMERDALVGKVEKSLQRRMHNQDATMKPKKEKVPEKAPLQSETNKAEKK